MPIMLLWLVQWIGPPTIHRSTPKSENMGPKIFPPKVLFKCKIRITLILFNYLSSLQRERGLLLVTIQKKKKKKIFALAPETDHICQMAIDPVLNSGRVTLIP